MESLKRSLGYALRSLLRRPGFTAVAVLTLALGIGANAALFSAVYAVVLRPLPYLEADRLVMLWRSEKGHGIDQDLTSYPNFYDWREQGKVFSNMAAFIYLDANLTGDGEPERLQEAMVSASFFDVLEVEPKVGRRFTPEEEQPGHDSVAILSHGLWQRRYASDPSIVGRTIELDGKPRTVVGVLPEGFDFSTKTAIWLPLSPNDAYRNTRGAFWLRVLGRLHPGVDLDQARAAMNIVGQRLAEDYPASNAGSGITLVPLHEQVVGGVRASLLILFGAVTFVLLIACSNVANLQLARSTAREREMAVRAAVGASRGNLLRQHLAESFWLALLGGAAGLWLAYLGLRGLVASSPQDVPRLHDVGIDGTVLGYTLLIVLATALLFGVLPTLRLTRLDLSQVLKDGEHRGLAGLSRGGGIRKPLVVAEIALALVLLIGTGLLVSSLRRLQKVDLGFNPRHLLTLQVGLAESKYRQPQQIQDFYWELLERVRTLPDVRSVAATSEVIEGEFAKTSTVAIEGKSLDPQLEQTEVAVNAVTPDLFHTLEIPLVAGRIFTQEDYRTGQGVVIVNQAMARRFFAGEDPLGKRLRYGGAYSHAPWLTVVGVVGDVRRSSVESEPMPASYRPLEQLAVATMRLVVRTDGDPMRLAPGIKQELAAMDPDQPVTDVATMQDLLSGPVAQRRFSLLLLGIFSGVAVALAVVGIYGVLSYLVAESTHEIGVRMALGARRSHLLRLVLDQGARLAALGLGIGLVAALMMTRLLSSLLFGVSATDPWTFGGVALLLGAVVLVASYLPARRAMRVEPLTALRYE